MWTVYCYIPHIQPHNNKYIYIYTYYVHPFSIQCDIIYIYIYTLRKKICIYNLCTCNALLLHDTPKIKISTQHPWCPALASDAVCCPALEAVCCRRCPELRWLRRPECRSGCHPGSPRWLLQKDYTRSHMSGGFQSVDNGHPYPLIGFWSWGGLLFWKSRLSIFKGLLGWR